VGISQYAYFSSISFLIVNYAPNLHVGLVGFVSLGSGNGCTGAVGSNLEDSKTGRVGALPFFFPSAVYVLVVHTLYTVKYSGNPTVLSPLRIS
jgi:hypothetical protein